MAVKFPWGRWKLPPLISHPLPVKTDSKCQLATNPNHPSREPHLRNHPDYLVVTPNVGSTFCEQPTSRGPGRWKVIHLLFHWPFLSWQVDLPITAVNFSPTLRTRISGLPLWTEDQQLSRKLPGFQGLAETLRHPGTCSEKLLG